METALGEAECAATQTVHLAASVALEWRWAANATTEQTVNSKQSNATFFEIERMIAIEMIP